MAEPHRCSATTRCLDPAGRPAIFQCSRRCSRVSSRSYVTRPSSSASASPNAVNGYGSAWASRAATWLSRPARTHARHLRHSLALAFRLSPDGVRIPRSISWPISQGCMDPVMVWRVSAHRAFASCARAREWNLEKRATRHTLQFLQPRSTRHTRHTVRESADNAPHLSVARGGACGASSCHP